MTRTGVEAVTVVRDRTSVLQDASLDAADGEFLVVLGSSGSGKSTLLRVLAGLDRPDAGRVFVKGRDVTELSPGERRVAMVFQSSALMPFLDVARNLSWGLEVQRVPEAEVQQRVSGRARQLRLSRLLSRRPGQLSGGERNLVGIGHSLVARPDAFLFDEPLGDLDPVQRTHVRRQIVDVVRSLGATAVYVTHDQAEGLAVADRVALLHQGTVVQVAPPRELYDRPVSLMAAEFVGSTPIGVLTARLVVSDGLAGFQVGTRTLPLWRPVPAPLQGHVGRDVLLGFRAEDVLPAAPDHDPDSVALDGLVTDVEYTGRQNLVALRTAARTIVAPRVEQDDAGGATLRSLFPPRTTVRRGDAVRVTVDAARAHVFDAASGEALWHPDGAP